MDDEEILRDTIEEMLMMLGYDVELARDAKEALEIARKEYCPLIITDLMMPSISGIRISRTTRSTLLSRASSIASRPSRAGRTW